MKAVVSVCAEAPVLSTAGINPAARLGRARVADYVELAKPRVAVLVLFTVGAGVLLAGGRDFSFLVLLHTVLGTALVAAGASALNQWLERDSDALMRRTEKRPLPSGRLQALEVFVFGLALGVGGVLYLALALSHVLSALIAAVTFVLYVAVYTPLKRRTPLNTLIGAVPGALPPLIGWCAVRGELTREAGVLFLILFLWQVPHFLAIAWMYRAEYARAGLLMLPVIDGDGRRTSQNMILYCLALLVVSLQPALYGDAGLLYLGGAALLGLTFLATALGFGRWRTHCQARRVMRTSLLYLPGLLALLLLDRALGL
ncbi:MAG TPA: heme o synthase [Gemmataceae bacterium]|nr:heme o synthase [Gemmataceae bacterium]